MVATDIDTLSKQVQSLQALTAFTFLHPGIFVLGSSIPTCQAFLAGCGALERLRLQFQGRDHRECLFLGVGDWFLNPTDVFDGVQLTAVTTMQLDTADTADPCAILSQFPGLLDVSLTLRYGGMQNSALSTLQSLQSCRIDPGESTHVFVTDSTLCDVLPHLPNTVTYLHLHEWVLGDAFPIILSLRKLQQLDLSESEVAHLPRVIDQVMRDFSKLSELKSLLWAGGKLRAEHTSALVQSLPGGITDLDLSGNQFPARAMQALGRLTHLHVLRMGWAGSRWWTHAVAIALANHFRPLVELRRLNIQVSDYHGTSAAAVEDILKTLKSLPYLRREDYTEIEGDMRVRQVAF